MSDMRTEIEELMNKDELSKIITDKDYNELKEQFYKYRKLYTRALDQRNSLSVIVFLNVLSVSWYYLLILWLLLLIGDPVVFIVVITITFIQGLWNGDFEYIWKDFIKILSRRKKKE